MYTADGGWVPGLDDALARPLSATEVENFRNYANESDPPDLDNWSSYHPVCRQTWADRGISPATLA
jgi:hypothetical protein